MNPVGVRGVGFVAPGLVGWDMAAPVFAGTAAYAPEPLPKLKPDWLPPNERRRLSQLMRLALTAGQEAVQQAAADAESLATVFASAIGDGDIIDKVCRELVRSDPALSPTQFHNSVHNAPAGYWSIAARSKASSTAVGAHDATFAAGLVEAATTAADRDAPVLLVAYDRPLPFPLGDTRDLSAPCASALLIGPAGPADAGRLGFTTADGGESRMEDAALEGLRTGNPAGRALPLLRLLARRESGRVVLPWVSGNGLAVEIDCG